MNQRIPSDFPKVWPYSPDYRGHVSKAIYLRENPSLILAVGFLLIVLGVAGMFICGFFDAHTAARGFGIVIPAGILLSIAGKKKRRKEFNRLMDEVTEQVASESALLKAKAVTTPKYEGVEDFENAIIVQSMMENHYTSNWAWVRGKLLERDGNRCCFCGRLVRLADSVAHHVAAFSEGGKTEFSNLVTVCVDCHSIIHPWLNPKLNIFWIRYERGRVYCWKCGSRLDTAKSKVILCSDCGWLHHITDGACGCNYPR